MARSDYLEGRSDAYSPQIRVPSSQHDQYINRHIELDLLDEPMSGRIQRERRTMEFEAVLARQAEEKEAERRRSRTAAANLQARKEARRAQMMPKNPGG